MTDWCATKKPIIEIRGLATYFGEHCVHENLDLTIFRGEICAIVGGTGSGKSTLLRQILMLERLSKGTIRIAGKELYTDPSAALFLQKNIGVMFQKGALFSSLTVQENVAFPLKLHTNLPFDMIDEIARLKIALVGLPSEAAIKYPDELSGGMIKRAAVARAIALDPELLFLDEPTAGLDPEGASALDSLIIELHASLGLTIVMVTHDLDTLWEVTERVAFLGDRRVLQVASMKELSESKEPLIKAYFSGSRGRRAQCVAETAPAEE